MIDGTADLRIVNEEAKQEEFTPDETELEIERKQEAQRIALAHGGFNDLIDFEKAILEGHGNYHESAGYGGMMHGKLPNKEDLKADDPLHQYLKHQKDEAAQEPLHSPMAETAKGEEPGIKTGQPVTAAPSGTAAPAADAPTVVAQPESAQPTASAAGGERAKDEL